MGLPGNIVASIRLDRDSLVSALMALSQADKDRNLFGSNGHDYRLNPKLKSSQLESFERVNRVELPEDYRRFITTIGNGGANPYYGLFRFGEEDANGQGQRTLNRWDSKDLRQVADVPACHPAPHRDAVLVLPLF